MHYHTERTAEWGHWGITFMDPQPNASANYGKIAGHISFPIGTRGPCDLDRREEYRAMIKAWIASRTIPDGFIAA